MINNEVDTIIRILRHDGTWDKYYIPAIAKYPTFDKIYFDSRGWTWATHRRKTAQGHHAGLLCINNQGTYDNHDDDDVTFQYRLDGTEDNINELYDIVEDKEGVMWIGTSMGPFVLRNPETIFENKPSFERIVVPRNDGTNLADYLMYGVDITAIAIDKANRKWIGTNGNGIYVISSDNMVQEKHFTTLDSPLLSDIIQYITIDDNTGRVYIGTDKGLCSYQSEVTQTNEEMDKDNVWVYPNPVTPEYNGMINVTGLSFNSDVKITSSNGTLVAQGRSTGGSFSWDGKDLKGNRVASGVYMVNSAKRDGSKGTVCKVTIIN